MFLDSISIHGNILKAKFPFDFGTVRFIVPKYFMIMNLQTYYNYENLFYITQYNKIIFEKLWKCMDYGSVTNPVYINVSGGLHKANHIENR